jgi:hypothetical protein
MRIKLIIIIKIKIKKGYLSRSRSRSRLLDLSRLSRGSRSLSRDLSFFEWCEECLRVGDRLLPREELSRRFSRSGDFSLSFIQPTGSLCKLLFFSSGRILVFPSPAPNLRGFQPLNTLARSTSTSILFPSIFRPSACRYAAELN